MKTLKLKELENFKYKEQLGAILGNAPTDGLSIDEVRKSVKAIDVLKAATKEVNFEDEIAQYVKERVSKSKFTVATPQLVEFLDDIDKM